MITEDQLKELNAVEIDTTKDYSPILKAITPKEGKEAPKMYSIKGNGKEFIYSEGEVFFHSEIVKVRKTKKAKVWFEDVTEYFAKPAPQDFETLKQMISE